MHFNLQIRFAGAFMTLVASAFADPLANEKYDPLSAPTNVKVVSHDFTITDKDRDREIPLRVILPETTKPLPVILFSHGLGGSRENGAYLLKHWAARGYAVVALQHIGSDESVWRGKGPAEAMKGMRTAANAKNFMDRVADVKFTIDELTKRNADSSSNLAGKFDLKHIGMSGHSFGALTTQAVSGQSLGRLNPADPRIDAALAMSPSSPRVGDVKTAFGDVEIPWLLMTGTKDVSPIGEQDVESRLAVFPALPPGNKYELVLHDGEHSAFSERALPGDRQKRNPNHHKVILALSTAFWDAYLKDDEAAKAWLDGHGPQAVIEKDDRWQKK